MTKHLKSLFTASQARLSASLGASQTALTHPGAKGEASESNWLDMLHSHLPHRYRADKASVIDSNGNTSDQIDVVIYDRQYTALLYNHDGQLYIPAESVYAVFEVKQNLDKEHIEYAGCKAASVRKLHRTSARIAHAGGEYKPRDLFSITAGILTYQSSWKPPFGDSLVQVLKSRPLTERLDLGCAVAHGAFEVEYQNNGAVELSTHEGQLGLIYFFFRLLGRLQSLGTVPAIDYEVYLSKVFANGQEK
jgi:hypothetical protein